MTVIFVCTGNTCRSPLAEGLAKKLAGERALAHVTFSSAGTGAFAGTPASDGSVLVGMERGVDLSRHRSREFRRAMVDANTIVLALSNSHLAGILAEAPNARAYLLDEYASHGHSRRSVRDPFGHDLAAYREVADQLETLLPAVLDRLASEQFVR